MSTPRPGPFPQPGPRPFPTPGQFPRPGQPAPATRPAPPVPGQPNAGQQGSGDGDARGTVARVDAAVAGLAELDELPVSAHVARYDALHGELSEALAAIDGV